MQHTTIRFAILSAVVLAAIGCWDPLVREVFTYEPGSSGPDSIGLGDACVTGDEAWPTFSGFSEGVINISSDDPQCASQLCLVSRFQGRATCPEGNLDGGECYTLLGERVTVPVQPALPDRSAQEAVICSCRCDGPRGQGPYCDCPSGMACESLIEASGPDFAAVAGSYCVWP